MSDASSPRLAVFKALGDNTRYAIYLELARSSHALTTAEIAETLDLHANTVRPHLERMREVGLLEVDSYARGTPGRPQHRYSLAPDAPSLGLEPPTFPVLARMLLQLAGSARLGEVEAVEAGRSQGGQDALSARTADPRPAPTTSARCVEALVSRLDELGFDPAVVEEEDAGAADAADAGAAAAGPGEAAGGSQDATTTVAFLHCPFRELAEADPDLVCGLHRGLVEGFVESLGGGAVSEFHPLLDRTPCQVSIATSGARA